MYECLYVCMYVHHVYQRGQKGIKSPEAGIIGSCKQPNVGDWEPSVFYKNSKYS